MWFQLIGPKGVMYKIEIIKAKGTSRNQMINQFYTREYLQGIPEKRKQEHVRLTLQASIQGIMNAAANGKTTYCIDIHTVQREMPGIVGMGKITMDDYITVLKIIFPDSQIEYREHWVELSATSKILQKGIVVDWS